MSVDTYAGHSSTVMKGDYIGSLKAPQITMQSKSKVQWHCYTQKKLRYHTNNYVGSTVCQRVKSILTARHQCSII